MEIDIINKQIGKKIKDLRHQVGLTQQELADRTELTRDIFRSSSTDW